MTNNSARIPSKKKRRDGGRGQAGSQKGDSKRITTTPHLVRPEVLSRRARACSPVSGPRREGKKESLSSRGVVYFIEK